MSELVGEQYRLEPVLDVPRVMGADSWPRELDVALHAVGEAAVLARDIRRRIGERALLKADRSPITVADLSVQALIAHRLGQAFPNDPLVAEEDSTSVRTQEATRSLESMLDVLRGTIPDVTADLALGLIDRGRGLPGDRFWTLDPIDGTKGFVRGDQYVVALALIVRGRVEIGLLGCPELALTGDEQHAGGSIVYAVRNRGAFCLSLKGHEPQALRVSSCGDAHHARILRSFEADHMDTGTFDEIIRTLHAVSAPTLMDSQAKHALIAAGQADLLIRIPKRPTFQEKIWDEAAGMLVVEEAGGCVTDMRGATLNFGMGRTLVGNQGVIVSNGRLHLAVLDAVRRVAGSP